MYKKLLKLAVWLATQEMNSHSLEVEELQIENWIESGQHHQKNGHKFLFFRDQLYLILITFFLLTNTSSIFLMMTFWIKLCNSLTCIIYNNISTNHWTSLQQTCKNGCVSSFISQYQNYQSRQCTGQKKISLSLIMQLKGMSTIQTWQAIIKTDAKRRCGYLSNEICFDKDALYTLSGRIGKVVAWNAKGYKVARSNPGYGWAATIYTMHEALRGYCPWGWGVRSVNWINRLWRHCP